MTDKTLIDEKYDTIIVSTQILGELYNALTKKGFLSKNEAEEIIIEMVATFPVIEIDIINVLKAIEINKKLRYSYWDSSVIATALLNDCSTFYSEDMQHDQLIENTLRIVNPLRST